MFKKSYPVFFRFFLWIIIPLMLALGAAFSYLTQSLPQKTGVLNVKGISASVKIVRDQNAVPHIYAETDSDAFFAIGYLHAQERMWQMEYQRRLGQGRLSEILGVNALSTDQMMRTLGLYNSAKTAFSTLDDATKQSLVAYAEGINAWIKEKHILPIEYLILGLQPTLWQPEDSILQVKLMALDLGQNFRQELTFDLLVKELGLDKATELMPDYPSSAITVTQAPGQINNNLLYNLLVLSDSITRPAKFNGSGIGSNAWVVSGSLSQSGKPLLAADPHLANQIPSAWYLMEVSGKDLHVTGATFPGVPYVIFGHNDSIAWGGTSLTADVQDLYVERVNPSNENQYEVDGKWVDMSVKDEWINIKPGLPAFLSDPIPPQKWKIRKTDHGPLISDALGKVDNPLALRWTALQESDDSIASLRSINYAKDWQMFTSALTGYVAPALNYIYADVQGNIAYIAAGKVPVRHQGDGKLPVPGWQSDFNWDGYVAMDKMPQSLNPKSGIIVSANNKVHTADYPYLISNSWSPPYRAERIAEAINANIQAGKKLTLQDFIAIQGDQKSLQATQLLPFLRQLSPKTPQQKEIIERFSNWDGVMSERSNTATIFQSWLRNFNEILLKDDLKGDLLHVERGDVLQNFVQQLHPLLINQILTSKKATAKSDWCDQINTADHENCNDLALVALDKAIDELKRYSGSNTRWGDIHKTHYPHPIFDHIRLLDLIFDREISNGGDSETVNVASWTYSQDKGYQQIIGPSYRQVIDLGAWEKSGFINNTGQSGNVFSKHYDDYVERHKNLELLPMFFNDKWNHEGDDTLLLKPI